MTTKLGALMCAAALVLGGCSGSDQNAQPTATPTDAVGGQATAQPSQQESAAEQISEEVKRAAQIKRGGAVIEIVIKDGKVTPQGKRVTVKPGGEITLIVSSDIADEIHVHSDPEHELEVPAGAHGKELTFTLNTPGQVAVESHHLDVTIVQLVVRP